MKPKFCHIITSLDIGGAETMLLRTVSHKPDLISNTIVISLTGIGEIGRRLEEIGVTVIALDIIDWRSAFRSLFVLRKLLDRYQPDLIHTWMYHANLLGGVASILTGHRRVVWSIRRSELTREESLSTYFLMKLGAYLSGLIPKVVVCVAESGLKNHRKYGYRADNMMVIPNGFDLEKFSRDESVRECVRRDLRIADNKVVIGCVGRFHKAKGYSSLIAASVNVIKYEPGVIFLLIGRNVDSKNYQLESWIRKTGNSSNFVLLGEKTNIAEYMNAMDIFCLPSVTEGFPNVVGEAMACGLPCVATSVGDVAKVSGDNAILVAPNDTASLSKGLCEMLSLHEGDRKRIGLNGRNKIMKEYSEKSACEKHFDLYASLLKDDDYYDAI